MLIADSFTMLSAVAACFAVLLSTALVLAVGPLLTGLGQPWPTAIIATSLCAAIQVGSLWYVGHRFFGRQAPTAVSTRGLLVGAGVGSIWLLVWGVIVLVLTTSPMSGAVSDLLDLQQGVFTTSVANSLLLIGGVGLLVPMYEEAVFRGLLWEAVMIRADYRWAWMVTSCLFGVLHFHPLLFVYATAFGVLAGFLRRRFHSIVPGLVAHVFVNTAVSVALAFGLWDWASA